MRMQCNPRNACLPISSCTIPLKRFFTLHLRIFQLYLISMTYLLPSPSVPKILTPVTGTSTSIKVNWTLPQNASKPGAYTYTVCARPTKSSTGVQICCYTDKESSCTVPHLDPNTAYNLTIDACSTFNTTLCSQKSDPLIVNTLPDGKSTVTFYRLQCLHLKT